MGTLIFTIFTIIFVVGALRDVAKKATKPIAEEVESTQEEEVDNQEMEDVEESAMESEDYLYYNMTSEGSVQPESQPIVDAKEEQPVVLNNVAMEDVNAVEFNFDLRQAIISQTILQNDYVDNLK